MSLRWNLSGWDLLNLDRGLQYEIVISVFRCFLRFHCKWSTVEPLYNGHIGTSGIGILVWNRTGFIYMEILYMEYIRQNGQTNQKSDIILTWVRCFPVHTPLHRVGTSAASHYQLSWPGYLHMHATKDSHMITVPTVIMMQTVVQDA